jgi:hypothetical protein
MNPDMEKADTKKAGTEKDQSSIIGDLLGHYSSRAVAHASFFIASIFGIVTLSATIQQLNEGAYWFPYILILSMFLFFPFSYMGYFTMARFGYYADLAEKLATWGLHQNNIMERIPYPPQSKRSLGDYFKSQTKRQEQYLFFRKRLVGQWSKEVLGIGYWFGIFLLGLIAYEKFLNTLLYLPFGIHVRFDYLFLSIFVLTVLIVILPIVIARHAESEKGYDLGKEVTEDKCKHICQEWTELEKQVLLLKAKKDFQKTEKKKNLRLLMKCSGCTRFLKQ